MPYVVTLFVQRSKDETVPLKELAAILETDSALTIGLLKYVNSSICGLRNKAKTVLAALSLLGCGKSRMFVIATGMEAAMQARFSKLIDQTAFWSDNLQKAIFARELAPLLGIDPEVVFIGTLLQDYLLPFLTNDLSDDYGEFLQSRETSGKTLSEFEQARFGWDHGLVGACLAHAWQLPWGACVLRSLPSWRLADLDRPEAGSIGCRRGRAVGPASRSVLSEPSRLATPGTTGTQMAGLFPRAVSPSGRPATSSNVPRHPPRLIAHGMLQEPGQREPTAVPVGTLATAAAD